MCQGTQGYLFSWRSHVCIDPATMDETPADMTPRTASFIAALHATKGDPEAAGLWMLELISWIVFQQRHVTEEVRPSPTVQQEPESVST